MSLPSGHHKAQEMLRGDVLAAELHEFADYVVGTYAELAAFPAYPVRAAGYLVKACCLQLKVCLYDAGVRCGVGLGVETSV